MLERNESYSHLRKLVKYLTNQRLYKQQALERKAAICLRHEENYARVFSPGEPRTNFPGYSTFLQRLSKNRERETFRLRVHASIRTDAPKLVFDFRYLKEHTRSHLLTSMSKQFNEVIFANRQKPEPLQLFFCNYDFESEFNKKYGDILDLEENLIHVTRQSYMDLFPKNKLVYLSKSSNDTMYEYDPDTLYIIGSLIDTVHADKHKFMSYNQAKKDGIRCQRLPLTEFMKYIFKIFILFHCALFHYALVVHK